MNTISKAGVCVAALALAALGASPAFAKDGADAGRVETPKPTASQTPRPVETEHPDEAEHSDEARRPIQKPRPSEVENETEHETEHEVEHEVENEVENENEAEHAGKGDMPAAGSATEPGPVAQLVAAGTLTQVQARQVRAAMESARATSRKQAIADTITNAVNAGTLSAEQGKIASRIASKAGKPTALRGVSKADRQAIKAVLVKAKAAAAKPELGTVLGSLVDRGTLTQEQATAILTALAIGTQTGTLPPVPSDVPADAGAAIPAA